MKSNNNNNLTSSPPPRALPPLTTSSLLPSNTAAAVVTSASPTPPQYFTKLNEFDVVCGRGSGANDKVGNVHFRNLVLTRKNDYLTVHQRDYESKKRVASEIVAAVRAKGGRFLKKVPEGQLRAEQNWTERARNEGENNGKNRDGPDEGMGTVLGSLKFEEGIEVFEFADEPTVLEKAKQALRQNRAVYETKKGSGVGKKIFAQSPEKNQQLTLPVAANHAETHISTAGRMARRMAISSPSINQSFNEFNESFGSANTLPRDNSTGNLKPQPVIMTNEGGGEPELLAPPPDPTSISTPEEWQAFQEYWSGPNIQRRRVWEQHLQEQNLIGEAISNFQRRKEALLQQQNYLQLQRQMNQQLLMQRQQFFAPTLHQQQQQFSTQQEPNFGIVSGNFQQQQSPPNPNEKIFRESCVSLPFQDLAAAAEDPIASNRSGENPHGNQYPVAQHTSVQQQKLRQMNLMQQQRMAEHQKNVLNLDERKPLETRSSLTIEDLEAAARLARRYCMASDAVPTDPPNYLDQVTSCNDRGRGADSSISISGTGNVSGSGNGGKEHIENAQSATHVVKALRHGSMEHISQNTAVPQQNVPYSMHGEEESMSIEPTHVSGVECSELVFSDAEMAILTSVNFDVSCLMGVEEEERKKRTPSILKKADAGSRSSKTTLDKTAKARKNTSFVDGSMTEKYSTCYERRRSSSSSSKKSIQTSHSSKSSGASSSGSSPGRPSMESFRTKMVSRAYNRGSNMSVSSRSSAGKESLDDMSLLSTMSLMSLGELSDIGLLRTGSWPTLTTEEPIHEASQVLDRAEKDSSLRNLMTCSQVEINANNRITRNMSGLGESTGSMFGSSLLSLDLMGQSWRDASQGSKQDDL